MRSASSASCTRLPVFLACAFLGGAAAFVPGRPLLYPAAHGRAGAAACALVRPLPRVVAPLCLAEDDEEAATEEELKDELFELLDEVQDRGLDASEDDVADILEIIAELEETEGGDTCFDFANSPLFAGTFRLLYTSSKTFHTNQGLMAYSRDFQGVKTPELLMKLQNSIGSRLVFFEEPLELQGNTLVGVLGGLTKTDVLRAECSWRATSSGVFAIEGQRITAGGRSWVPADRQAKGIRAVSACRPVYLDDELLVLRGQIQEVVFVFERDD